MSPLRIFNTLGRTVEEFSPREKNTVLLYVCGITPYDFAHIGHGRCYVTFDVLVRLLKHLGYAVRYVRNITDIDDKLLDKAAAQGDMMGYRDLAQKYFAAFQGDLSKLNCLPPDVEPTVTGNIDAIISFIQTLIDQGHAYPADGDVYFAIQSFPAYGKLSGRKLDEMQVGARVAVSDRKRHPEDFVLWKGCAEGKFWDSPWGNGRPGWHIECSALAQKYLGDTIDIHGGGMDLIFPHHENEVAQSECRTGACFARHWLHNAFVNIDKEKMSKSLGNVLVLHEIFKKFDPMVLRFYFLQHHYKTPIDFSFDGLDAAQKAYKKLVGVFAAATPVAAVTPLVTAMEEALCDDLNTPRLLGLLFEHIELLQQDGNACAAAKSFVMNVTGLTLAPLTEKTVEITPEIQALIDERESARTAKNWQRADEIRDQLRTLGFEVRDAK